MDTPCDLHHQQHRVVELPAAQDHPGTAARVLNDAAVVKLLWLAIRDIEDKRARERAKQVGTPRAQRTALGKLVEGSTIQGWIKASTNSPSATRNVSPKPTKPSHLHKQVDSSCGGAGTIHEPSLTKFSVSVQPPVSALTKDPHRFRRMSHSHLSTITQWTSNSRP